MKYQKDANGTFSVPSIISPTFFLYPLTNLEGSAVYVVLIRMTLVSLL